MRKLFLLIGIVTVSLLSTSCASTLRTATWKDVVNFKVANFTAADLDVSPRKITYTYTVGKDVKRTGMVNIVNSAVAAALEANGNADVLVAMETIVKSKISGIKSVTVTGYPARYVNFRNVPVTDDVHTVLQETTQAGKKRSLLHKFGF